MKAKLIPGIPQQIKGSFHDTESYREYETTEAALANYQSLHSRLLNINDWREYCNKKSADFKLYDPQGNHITRCPQENDLIRIDIPGPGNPEADGYDWAKIVKISTDTLEAGEIENLSITIVPTKIPNCKNNHISHFYSEGSSSIFKIARGSNYIKMAVYGRNETPNMNTNIAGKIRNLMIAVGGMFGISKVQWKVYADEMLKI